MTRREFIWALGAVACSVRQITRSRDHEIASYVTEAEADAYASQVLRSVFDPGALQAGDIVTIASEGPRQFRVTDVVTGVSLAVIPEWSPEARHG